MRRSTASSLARIAPLCREPDPDAAKRAAREAWHTAGLVLINPEWLAGWVDRQQLILLAEKVHGPRPKPPDGREQRTTHD